MTAGTPTAELAPIESAGEALDTLRAFGIGEYGARAYLALLELGTSEARPISRRARVPLAKVYSVLDQLQERGLVRIIPEKPKRFEPVPIEEYLAAQRRDHAERIRELEAAEPRLVRLFPILGKQQVGDRGGVSVMRGRAAANDRIASVLAHARRDVLYAPAASWPQRADAIADLVGKAAARGADIRMLLPADQAPGEALTMLEGAGKLRVRDRSAGEPGSVCLFAVDGQTLLLQHRVPDDASARDGKDYLLEIHEEGIVAAILAHLEARWAHASPL